MKKKKIWCIIYVEFVYYFSDTNNNRGLNLIMKIIGLTGPSGAGKGFCYGFFEKHNIPCIDTDDVYHKLLIPPSKCVCDLVENFGNEIFDENTGIDRKKLADIVFSDISHKKLDTLNRITHKYVLEKTHELIALYKKQEKIAVVIDAPLLFEAEFDKFCDFTIAVIADEKTRMARIMKRDSLIYKAAKQRINSQNPDEFYTSRANYTVVNNTDTYSLEDQLNTIFIKEKLI